MNIGDMGVPFIYQGEELIHPNPVKDGLVLWYDFSGMTNNDASKDIARDLSGNGNHGTLQNFNFTPESGYDKNKLLFDGADDQVVVNSLPMNVNQVTEEAVVEFNYNESNPYQTIFVRQGKWNYSIVFSALSIRSIVLPKDGSRINQLVTAPREKVFHVCRTIDRANEKVSFYINGQLVDTAKLLSDVNDSGNLYDSLYIGGANMDYSEGSIHSTKVYNRPLTPEEVAHNYAIEKERFSIE